jgi:uncharacterized protein YkwD/uncharacterized protein YraI
MMLVAASALVVGAVAPAINQVAAQAAPGVCADAEEMRFLDLLNEYRGQQGLSPLALSQALSEAAEFHSADMAARGYFDHTMADGTTVEQNLRNFGYRDGTFGENILAGTEGADGALETWRNSASHDANMRRGAFEAIGIGRVNDPSSPYGWYWTTIFGGSLDERGVVCGEDRGPREGRRGVVNDPDVNLRSGPDRQSSVLDVLDDGTEVAVTGEQQDGYLPVEVGGLSGWVAAEWLDVEEMEAPEQPAAASVTETVNLRSGPSRDAEVASIIPGGSPISLSGREQDGYLEATWEGTTGWIDAAYVSGAEALMESAETIAQSGQVAESPAGTATTTDDVNVRSGPDRTAEVIEVLTAGTAVGLNGERVNGFVGVIIDGGRGWIDAAYLR